MPGMLDPALDILQAGNPGVTVNPTPPPNALPQTGLLAPWDPKTQATPEQMQQAIQALYARQPVPDQMKPRQPDTDLGAMQNFMNPTQFQHGPVMTYDQGKPLTQEDLDKRYSLSLNDRG